MKYLWTLLISFLLLVQTANAQSGLFIAPSTSVFTSPVTGQSWLFNSTNKTVSVYTGSGYLSVSTPFSNYTASTNPTTSNDNTQGYVIGSLWVNQNTQTIYMATSVATSAAVWLGVNQITGSVPLTNLQQGGASSGQSIVWNGTNWAAANPAIALGQLTQSGASSGQVPSWNGTAWVPSNAAAGTVTSVSIGNLSPLFNASVSTATSTPAISFAQQNAGANTIFSNTSGSSGAPAFNSLSITAGTGLSGGGNLTSSPTINLTTPVAVANGGTGVATAGAHSFFGNNTGSTASPSFVAIGINDLPNNVVNSVSNSATVLGASVSANNLALSYSGTALPIANGGTAATTAAAAISNLIAGSPTMNQALVYNGTNWVPTTISSSGTVTSVAMTGDGTIFNSSVTGSPITTSGTLVPVLLAQNANIILAGPSSGSSATPTFRHLVAADEPSTTVNSTGNLSPLFTSSISAQALSFSLTNAASKGILSNTSGSAAAPAYNALTITAGTGLSGGGNLADSPTVSLSVPVTIVNGGSGLTSTPTDGQFLIGNSNTNAYVLATLTAGNGISVTNGHGTSTVAIVSPVTIANGGTELTSSPTDGQLLIGNTSTGKFNLSALTAGSGVTITNGGGSITIAAASGGGTVTTTGSPASGNLSKFSGTTSITNGDLSGDITTSGTLAATLATVNSNTGSFGSSTAIPSFTVNGKGLITAASTNAVIAPAGTLTGTTLASNVVTSSLTTVGTIGTGVWQGTPVVVTYGGTGLATLTNHAIQVGAGTSNVTQIGPGSTSGIPLIAQGVSADPVFGTTIVGGGGTGLTTLTNHSVLVGAGTSNLTQIGPSATTGQPLLSQGSSADPAFGTLGVGSGGTGITTTPSNGFVPIGNGTNYTAAAITAGAGISVTNGSGSITVASSVAGFGGNGSDSSISNPSSYTGPIQKNATTFSLTGANTLTTTLSPIIINCTSTFTLGDGTNASTITLTAGSGPKGGNGGPGVLATFGGNGSNGSGLAGGDSFGSFAGTGGGFGGAGGGGGSTGASNTGQNGSTGTYGSCLQGGSGGGGGSGYSTATGTGGAGGNGGGTLIVAAVGAINCQAASIINAQGTAGSAGTTFGAGGGGGSGGEVFLASQTSVTVAGTINVSGGTGGAGTGTGGVPGGGGGGGGVIIIWSPSNSTGSATFTRTGGSGGAAASAGQAGAAGGTGTQTSITGTPNMPLLTWGRSEKGLSYICLLRALGNENINQRSLSWEAGDHTIQGFAYFNCGNYEGSVCLGVGDSVSAGDDIS